MRRPWVPVVALALLAVSAPARAGARRVLVFPLAGAVPGHGAAALDRLTRVIARSAGLAGAEVTIGGASFDDTAALVGCGAPDAACLSQVATSLRVDELVVGTVQAADAGSATVTLRFFRDGAVTEHVFTLPAGDLDTMVQRLAREAPAIFVGSSEPPPPPPEADPTPAPPFPSAPPPPVNPAPPAVTPDPEPRGTAGPRGFARVGATWWVVAAAGVGLAGAGGWLLLEASALQDEVDAAPTRTAADLDRLVELEDEGERYTILGNGLLIAGGAAVAVGGAMILYRGLAAERERPAFSVTPMPLRGGGALVLELPLP